MSRADRIAKAGFLNVKEAAKRLGVSKTTMYVLIKSKTITHARWGGVWVVSELALTEYMKSRMILGNVA